MVVLRIKEYDNGEVALEYRTTKNNGSMTISNRKIKLSGYHYYRLGTFGEKNGCIVGSNNPMEAGRSFDLIKALSEMGENGVTDFTIELAASHNEYLEERIESIIRILRLVPEDVLLVIPSS